MSTVQTSLSLHRDALTYRRLMRSIVRDWGKVGPWVLGPLSWPTHPFALARFGVPALLPATALAGMLFEGKHARGLFAGLAAHSMLPLDAPVEVELVMSATTMLGEDDATLGDVVAAARTCSYPSPMGWTSVELRDWKSEKSLATAVKPGALRIIRMP